MISNMSELKESAVWTGTFGPRVDGSGCLFRLWARPDATVELILEEGSSSRAGSSSRSVPMQLDSSGMYQAYVEGAGPGTRYWFKLDGAGPYPDPASRYQPLGVHCPSQVLGPSKFSWAEDHYKVPPLRELVIYELHVGTFTPAGTFSAVIEKLDDLRELGMNAIELMPIAEFPGERNWGYDGVSLYAPAHSYGSPDDLRTLVREAHRRGFAVCLDVVYNHLGPDGAYHSLFAPRFYSGKHHTPWGDGLNFDGDGREKVRNYFIESALEWVNEYHIDGLRCDATDTIQDDSKPHFLTELTERVHAAAEEMGRAVFLIAEDSRNERKVVLPPEAGGHGFDAVWSDDFHHHMRHRLAGDSDGYYCDFDGTAGHIVETLEDGWSFKGQLSRHWGYARGTSAEGLTRESRVICLQNHDQIGNRAFGERFSTQVSRPAFYAASALLLLAPEVPLIFMGQEWAAPEPFLFFTDHNAELGRLVTEGRRKEFMHFDAFADEARRESIPDPQADSTFLASKLDWSKRA
ncbi:MAG: malto-oligosyltrehalose trehalohydrolase, partial [Acidobacteriaceae bacterium]